MSTDSLEKNAFESSGVVRFFFSFHRQVVSDITDNNFLKREKNFCILFKVPFL